LSALLARGIDTFRTLLKGLRKKGPFHFPFCLFHAVPSLSSWLQAPPISPLSSPTSGSSSHSFAPHKMSQGPRFSIARVLPSPLLSLFFWGLPKPLLLPPLWLPPSFATKFHLAAFLLHYIYHLVLVGFFQLWAFFSCGKLAGLEQMPPSPWRFLPRPHICYSVFPTPPPLSHTSLLSSRTTSPYSLKYPPPHLKLVFSPALLSCSCPLHPYLSPPTSLHFKPLSTPKYFLHSPHSLTRSISPPSPF